MDIYEMFGMNNIDKAVEHLRGEVDKISKEYKLKYKITSKQIGANYQVYVLIDNGRGKCQTFNTVPSPIYQIRGELNKLLFQIELVKEYFK